MNDIADHMAGGGCQDHEEYIRLVGKVEALALLSVTSLIWRKDWKRNKGSVPICYAILFLWRLSGITLQGTVNLNHCKEDRCILPKIDRYGRIQDARTVWLQTLDKAT